VTALASCLYQGAIVHRRYRPLRHALSYHVNNVFLDVDQLGAISKASWLFGYNQRKLFGINDRSHGAGTSQSLAAQAWSLMRGLPQGGDITRIFMFCYPNVLGFVFNPLTIYFGFDAQNKICAAIYEVNNFHGERHSYVLETAAGASHEAGKAFYVSPFNAVEGTYHFHLLMEDERLRINIALLEGKAMKLCARFEGQRQALSDSALLRGLFSLAVQPIKVVAAILWESTKLHVKGLRILARPAHPRWSATLSATLPLTPIKKVN